MTKIILKLIEKYLSQALETVVPGRLPANINPTAA